MPLVPATPKAASDDGRKAIGFWMAVEGEQPVKPVKVFVTYAALGQLDPLQVPDLNGAFEIFEAHRHKIERLASERFDARGADDVSYEGQLVVTLGAGALLD